MSVTIDIIDQDVFGAMRAFLLSFLPTGTEVVQAQDNLVAMPLGGFVTMNNVSQERLATNIHNYQYALNGTQDIWTQVKYGMQLDFYGPLSQSWAMMCMSLFRDEYATSSMPANIQPLYSDTPMQIPLIDGEAQYEQRWKILAFMQYNPIITASQDYAASLEVGVVDVDVKFPP